ncbi:MAG: DUF47 domain-containing protein [Candidatus Bipolaricaulaceae bacterium]
MVWWRRPLARLLGRSTLVPLEQHAQAVERAAEELGRQLRAWLRGEVVDAEVVSEAEHQADLLKRQVRAALNQARWVPVSKPHLLALLWHQDEIADLCQDAALLMALRRPALGIELEDGFQTLAEAVTRAVHQFRLTIEEFQEALSVGLPRGKLPLVVEGVDKINLLEHESDLIERQLVETIYRADGVSDFERYHLVQLVLMLGGIVDQIENAAGDLRVMAALS